VDASGARCRQCVRSVEAELALRPRPRREGAVFGPPPGSGVERPVPPSREAPAMVRPDRLLGQLAERAVDAFDDARRRHAGYWPLPLVVVVGGAGGAVVVGGAGGGAGVDVVV